MKIRTNIKSGKNGELVVADHNHNEKMASDSNNSIGQKKTLGKKLRLNKETIRDLKDTDLKRVNGGMRPETQWTYCDQVPTQCYKPNPY